MPTRRAATHITHGGRAGSARGADNVHETVRADEVTNTEIGARLKELRQQHGMSIRALAREAGVSASLLSVAERGMVEPSVGVLKKLVGVLDVNLTYFFSRPGSAGELCVRKGERRKLERVKGASYELLGPDDRMMEPVFARLEPRANSDPKKRVFLQHDGEEWGLVLSGRLKVWVGNEVYLLDPGDTVYFSSTVPHWVANPTDEVTEYIWVNTPATF